METIKKEKYEKPIIEVIEIETEVMAQSPTYNQDMDNTVEEDHAAAYSHRKKFWD